MEEFICPYCNKIYKSVNAWRSHKGYCKKNPNWKPRSEKFLNAVRSFDHKNKQEKKLFICDFCGKEWETTKTGFEIHRRSCIKNPNRVESTWKGRHHSEKSKEKMKKTIKDNSENHFTWGKLSQRTKGEHSYPEKWLIEVLKNEFSLKENIDYKTEVKFHTFWLDFVFGENYVIEMDGSQHQNDEYQKDCDKRKDELLKKENFKELRISWENCKINPKENIELIKNFLDSWLSGLKR